MKNTIGILTICASVFVLGFAYNADWQNRNIPCRRVPSQAAATSASMAIDQFYVEYGKLPDVGGRLRTDGGEGVELLNILAANEPESGELQNLRQIPFLSALKFKGDRAGLVYDGKGSRITGLYDSWGHPYTVVLDTDSDEVLEFRHGSRTVELKGRRAVVFGSGKDGKYGTLDDYKTW